MYATQQRPSFDVGDPLVGGADRSTAFIWMRQTDSRPGGGTVPWMVRRHWGLDPMPFQSVPDARGDAGLDGVFEGVHPFRSRLPTVPAALPPFDRWPQQHPALEESSCRSCPNVRERFWQSGANVGVVLSFVGRKINRHSTGRSCQLAGSQNGNPSSLPRGLFFKPQSRGLNVVPSGGPPTSVKRSVARLPQLECDV